MFQVLFILGIPRSKFGFLGTLGVFLASSSVSYAVWKYMSSPAKLGQDSCCFVKKRIPGNKKGFRPRNRWWGGDAAERIAPEWFSRWWHRKKCPIFWKLIHKAPRTNTFYLECQNEYFRSGNLSSALIDYEGNPFIMVASFFFTKQQEYLDILSQLRGGAHMCLGSANNMI